MAAPSAPSKPLADLSNRIQALSNAAPITPVPADGASKLHDSEYSVQLTLADQSEAAISNSPLYSVKSFEELGLAPELLKGIYAMHFTRPSKIQERALPLLLQDPPRNMIGQSQSGTGKTAAFVLTMLSRIDFSVHAPQAIALAPSRELVRQIMDAAKEMGKFTPVKTLLAVPNAPGTKRSDGPTDAQLIIGTPGKILDLIRNNVISPDKIQVFVLDEADKMLDAQGLGDQSVRVKNAMPKACQLVLFSATFPNHVREFASKIAPGANEIRLRQDELNVEGIKQFFMDCNGAEARYDVLVDLYNLLTIGQSIIFCSKRAVADQVTKRMTAEGHKVDSLHGKLDIKSREETIDRFRNGEIKVLIATNVLARGIDCPQVNLVLSWDISTSPDGKQADVETYLHRIGRTGRFGRTGVCINFVYDHQSWHYLRQIEETLGVSIIRVPTNSIEEMETTIKDALKK